jgi:hypothetical protein
MTKNLPKLLAAKIQPPPEIMLGRQLYFQLDKELEINRPKYLRQITCTTNRLENGISITPYIIAHQRMMCGVK